MADPSPTGGLDVPPQPAVGTMFAHQDDLPRLPVPPLDKTLRRYLRSTQPLVTVEEYERTKAAVDDFRSNLGPVLQARLEAHEAALAAEGTESWLERWWLGGAYHAYRADTPTNVNWFMVPDPHPRAAEGKSVDPIVRAAFLVHQWFVGLFELQSGAWEPDAIRRGKTKLCMWQYQFVFGLSRVPEAGQDRLAIFPFEEARKCVVLIDGQQYWMVCCDDDGPFSPGVIYKQLLAVHAAHKEATYHHPDMGFLTGDHRDTWAENYAALLSADPTHVDNMRIIESAGLVVSFDAIAPSNPDELMNATAATTGSGANRWFDKPVNFVFFSNGELGTSGEHSPSDAPQPAVFLNNGLLLESEETYSAVAATRLDDITLVGDAVPTRLVWNLGPDLGRRIAASRDYVAARMADCDLCALGFDDFGTDEIKALKISPDAFMQMAIQLAHFRLHKIVVGTYETASTRQFFHGRTETVRTLSNEVVAFVRAFSDADCWVGRPAEARDILQAAVDAHIEYMRAASNGEGVDRHLLGLRFVLEPEDGTPDIFADPAFRRSSAFRISTSNISGRLYYGGFHPTEENGYGCCYALTKGSIRGLISARFSCLERSAPAFRDELMTALRDMRAVCRAVSSL